MKQQAERLAQNKIDYIVFHRPKEVADLLYDNGFEPPKDPEELSEAIKELSRKKGKKFLEALVQLHPDKKVILGLNNPKQKACDGCKKHTYNEEGNYCSSCGHSNYIGSGDEDSFLGQFDSFKDKELDQYYKGIVQKSNKNPDDKNLAQEVQMIWNEIRLRKTKNKEEQPQLTASKSYQITKDELLLMGVVFIAGALVGHGLKFNFNNGK